MAVSKAFVFGDHTGKRWKLKGLVGNQIHQVCFLASYLIFPLFFLNNRYEMTVQNVEIRMFRNVVGHEKLESC